MNDVGILAKKDSCQTFTCGLLAYEATKQSPSPPVRTRREKEFHEQGGGHTADVAPNRRSEAK